MGVKLLDIVALAPIDVRRIAGRASKLDHVRVLSPDSPTGCSLQGHLSRGSSCAPSGAPRPAPPAVVES
jgi:hypothetical protein